MVWFGGQKSAQERKRVEPNEKATPEGWTKENIHKQKCAQLIQSKTVVTFQISIIVFFFL